MNTKDDKMIVRFNMIGICVNLVINDSRNPAIINNGINPIIIFTPSLAAIRNDCLLENVLGNKILLPRINPAAPAIIIDYISIIP
jgi:hypothetical protein